MSRIQDILNKAERDGTARRTRSLNDESAARPTSDGHRVTQTAVDDAVPERAFVDTPARRPTTPPGTVRAVRALRQDVGLPAAPIDPPRTARAEPTLHVTHGAHAMAAPAVPPPSVDDTPAEAAPRSSTSLDHRLVAALAPTSLPAEQYRSLRTRLKQAESGRSVRSIAITSPSKGDGKSLTAANLALTMAQEFQQRVLLIDADLRRPTVHSLFGLADTPGLVDVLLNVAELDQALVFLPEHHLTVLPAGVPPGHPAELLGSATMRRTLDALRTRYDRILIDVPPVAPLADLQVLAPMVDGLLMIVRAGVTSKPAIERALSELDAAKVLGLVLNEAGSQGGDEYTYEGYGYVAG